MDMRRLALLLSLLLAPALFAAERVLVPVAYTGPGVRGAFWWTNVDAWNSSAVPWSSPGVRFFISCPLPEGCVADELGPGESGTLFAGSPLVQLQAPHGYLLYVPDEVAARPTLFTRLSWAPFNTPVGLELPMPTEHEFRSTPLRFPHVPIIGEFRTLLRVYALDLQAPLTVRILGTNLSGTGTVAEQHLVIQPSSSPELYPSYGELALERSPFVGTGMAYLNVEVVPADGQGTPKVWAFISVTHNFNATRVEIIPPR